MYINMNCKNKCAFITLELLLVIVIASIILISSFKIITNIYQNAKTSQNISISQLDLLSSRII
ncbi:hypothetical protein CPG38_12770, partial [Malaciobacter marinus]